MFIELILGIYGFLSLIIIRGANAYFQYFGFGYSFDFLINFIVLILPTLLMGMSFPIMLHIYRNVFSVGRAGGIVYSANIVGAAVGALATGFLLISIIGMSSSCQLAAFINVALGLVVFIAFNFIKSVGKDFINAESTVNLQNQKPPLIGIRFLILSFISGFVALSYEIIFFRVFTTYFGANVYVFPILLFSYLAMMAVGNRYYGQKADKLPSEFLFVSMAVFAILTTLMVLYGQEIAFRIGFRQNYFVFWSFRTWLAFAQIVPILIVSFILMAPVAFISGFFPVIIKSVARNPPLIPNW